ncbi:MAG: DsbA family protein [Gemmatimonadaceae bacterium]
MVKKAKRATKGAGGGRGGGKGFYVVLGAIAVIGVVFLYYQTRSGSAAGGQSVTVDPSVPLPTAEGYVLGSADAPLEVIEYADFECPVCGQFALVTEPDIRKRLIETGQIRMRYMNYHIPSHPNTWAASHAAACAHEQGKFWEMHDAIYETQDRWSGFATRKPKGVFQQLAGRVGLNRDQWEACFDSKKYEPQLQASQRDAEKRQVSGTPTFIIGTRMIAHSLAYDQFKAYVDSALADKGAVPNDSAK